MSWDTGATGGGDAWNGGDATSAAADARDAWGAGGDDAAGGGGGDERVLTGECYNCGEVGHNKADCTNPRVERPFTGTCNACGQEGHAARSCPTSPQKCRLCDQEGHRALDCKSRRIVNWTGVPELLAEQAWGALVDAATVKDVDAFRVALRAYARALDDQFDLPAVEEALRSDDLGVYLIAKQQDIAPNMTIIDLIGNPDREFVLSIQLSPKPRRARMAQGWPENQEQNMERLASAGFVEDRGVPLCNNCGELGHIRKHCKQELVERENTQREIHCFNCEADGHRARDCPKERVNRYACKNCKQDGHTSKECPEPRSAEGVECHKCNETGHFSKDCPNVEKRTCRNCGSEDHMAKECDQPRNPDLITCRNCEKQGHMSRDCPEPKDWSKVKCSNCGEMGHTVKRCKQPVAEDGGAGDGGSAWADSGAAVSTDAAGGDKPAWTDTAAATGGGEASWGGGGW